MSVRNANASKIINGPLIATGIDRSMYPRTTSEAPTNRLLMVIPITSTCRGAKWVSRLVCLTLKPPEELSSCIEDLANSRPERSKIVAPGFGELKRFCGYIPPVRWQPLLTAGWCPPRGSALPFPEVKPAANKERAPRDGGV